MPSDNPIKDENEKKRDGALRDRAMEFAVRSYDGKSNGDDFIVRRAETILKFLKGMQ